MSIQYIHYCLMLIRVENRNKILKIDLLSTEEKALFSNLKIREYSI